MIAPWMLYAALLGALVSLVALPLERVAALWRMPRRGIWMAAIAASAFVPLGVLMTPAAPPPATQPSLEVGEVTAGPIAALEMERSAVGRLRERVTASMTAAGRAVQPLDRPLAVIWGASSLAVLLLLAGSALRLHRHRRGWELRVVDGAEVLVADDLGPAALLGPAPGIVLPRWALDLDAPLRRLVLRHELEHRAAGDPWLLLAGLVAIALTPWNPALWWQLGRLRLAVEMDCDHRVLRVHDASPAGVERYGLLLIALGQRSNGLLHLAAPALSEPVSTLERRIAAMTYRIPRRRWLHAAALAAVAGAMTAVACFAPTPDRVAGPDTAEPLASVASPVDENQTYFEFQVEEPVAPHNNASPVFPEELRARGVTGRVIAQFVVDTTGLADVGTFMVLESSDAQFTDAVQAALPDMRFTPAEVGGHKVRQLVQQPFVFGEQRRRTTATQGDGATVPVEQLVLETSTTTPATQDGATTYFEFQVEKPVTALRNVSPDYPPELRAGGVTGRVIAQFVVGTDGVPDASTFKVLQSDHGLFSAAVREALPRMRYTPAEVGGHTVKQLVQQPFDFRDDR